MLLNNADARRCSYFELGLPVLRGITVVILYDETGKTLYTVQKKQYDSYSFTAQTEGVYKFCFSNEFSTFSHKVVYFDFQAGDETPLTKEMAWGPTIRL